MPQLDPTQSEQMFSGFRHEETLAGAIGTGEKCHKQP
jgi:hypothetical protein